jgi:hypothetical protein
MKISRLFLAGLVLDSFLLLASSSFVRAATTIDSANRYAYGANVGWMDWVADTNNGAVIGEYVCSGNIYSANVGWIALGSGTPTNGIYYQNLSANDFGVNQDGLGNLRGYAWGANIGWINFESTGAPRVDLGTGNLSGYAWSANCGWISLSNAVAYVQTDSIQQGALAPDGLPIVAWLLTYFGTTNVNANADPTGKGMTLAQDYEAGTNPTNATDVLRITSYKRNTIAANYNLFAWTSKPTRFYTVQYCSALNPNPTWTDYGYFTVPGVSGTGYYDYNALRFYRIRAYRPLMP